jgi:hypothetical protein
VPDAYPAQNPRAAWRVYDHEAVIVSPDDSSLHTLNEVGTFVWQAADGATSVADIVRGLCETFDVTTARAEDDLRRFLDELTGRGLLTIADAPKT